MNNLFNRLTKNAKQAIKLSQKLSRQSDLAKIPPAFLLKAISEQQGSLGQNIIRNFPSKKKNLIISKKKSIIITTKEKKFSSVHDILLKAYQLASSSKNSHVGTEHLVYGWLFLNDQDVSHSSLNEISPASSAAKNLPSLNGKNPPIGDIFGELNMLIDNFFASGKEKNKKASLLGSYAANLNETTDPKNNVLIGRKAELERITNILGRKFKNNPVLVGDPGVGKTAIVEGLALRIKNGRAPYYLSQKKIMSLDLGSLIAGTTFRGEFEARLKEIINEAKRDRNIILFIDEIHNLVGAGNAVGGMDAANLLKPALSRGEIQVIGATTFDEYRKYIEKDSALERRFQPVMVSEPTVDETIAILRGIRPSYEEFHNIKISDAALEKSALLAKRYLHERFLPDSAIDLVDETSARIRAKVTHAKIFQEVANKQSQLDSIIENKEMLVLNDRYEEAIAFREEEKKLNKELTLLKKKQKQFEQQHPIDLDESEIRETVSIMTKIPVNLLANRNSATVENTRILLQKELVGQPDVIGKIGNTLVRQFSGIGNPNRPLGSFLFVGPTGVGKTMTAKLLSEAMSPGSQESLVQINMSEFMERHTVSRLLGAPAGYVGYEESGELTEKVRRNPYSVLLFDEIEKSDPSVLNILLQILEEGTLTDAKGRKVNFKNTIVILTSNIGTYELNQLSTLGFETIIPDKLAKHHHKTRQTVLDELYQQLPVELVNRLDHLIVFNPLDKKAIQTIVQQRLTKLAKRLEEKKIQLFFDQKSVGYLCEQSQDPNQGARLVSRKIEELVEPLVAEKILSSNNLKEIRLTFKKGKLTVK